MRAHMAGQCQARSPESMRAGASSKMHQAHHRIRESLFTPHCLKEHTVSFLEKMGQSFQHTLEARR